MTAELPSTSRAHNSTMPVPVREEHIGMSPPAYSAWRAVT